MSIQDSAAADVSPADIVAQPEHMSKSQANHSPPVHDIAFDLNLDESEPEKDVIPEDGYGWVCVACNFWINAHTWGINSSYGVFLSYYLSNDVFPNTSSLSYAFMGGLSIACSLLIAPLATFLIDLWGNRTVRNIGVVVETVAFIAASFSKQGYQIFLSQSICFGFGFGLLYVASSGITPQWFLRRRSMAQGLTSAGSGFGGMVYSLAVGAMIPKLGLPWTFRTIAILTFVVNLVASNLLRDRNKAVGSRYKALNFSFLKMFEFLLYLGWGILSCLGYVVLLFSIANFCLSIGLSAKQGIIVTAILNLGQMVGRPVVGWASDSLGRINIASILSFLAGVLCLVWWIFAKDMAAVCSFAFVIGILSGTFWATSAPVLAEVVVLPDLPAGISLAYLVLVAPTAVAEAIGLQLRDNSDSGSAYLRDQLFAGFMYIGSALCLWLVRGWKIGAVGKERAREASRVGGVVQKPSHGGSLSNLETTTETVGTSRMVQVWNPVTLIRRSLKLARV